MSGEVPAVERPGTAGADNRVECERSPRFSAPATCALEERRPRHFSSIFNSQNGHSSPTKKKEEERQNRCAKGTSAGEKAGFDERSGSEKTDFSPATGDPIACRSAITERNPAPSSVIAPLRLCVFAGWLAGWALRSSRFLGRAGPEGPAYRCSQKTGWVGALRLCGSAPLRFSWCSPLVSWCLGGSSFPRPSENRL